MAVRQLFSGPARFFVALTLVIAVISVLAMPFRGALTRPLVFPAPNYRFTPALPGGKIVTARTSRIAYGYYAKAGQKLVVLFHGNGEVMGSMQGIAELLLREGYSVLMTEYPGYGFAAEYPVSEQNIYEDTAALLKLMREAYNHTAKDTILWGFSLGTGVATEMAAQKLGEKLILMAPFTSAPDTAAHHFFSLARHLVVDVFNNKAKAPLIEMATLIVHGSADSVIPVSMGQELSTLFRSNELIIVPNADHNDLLARLTPGHWQKILRFVRAA
ncbi:alpha/beta hydrolase [Turneriella parva]|uniref:alpha/beta hydrolase n=1 Tax=Turneriella parva TaxID=29510 RepID=UPI00031A8EA6|nr:alpha/beta hydrolase [Turneriella parva]